MNTARALVAILMGAGCVGRPATLGAIDSAGASAGGSEGGDAGDSSSGSSDDGQSSGDESGSGGVEACDTIDVGVGSERRLDDQQYANTIRDLFGVTYSFGPDEGDPFPTAWTGNPGAAYVQAASDVAALVDLAAIAPCILDPGPEGPCIESLVDDLGPRAFRRPLSAAERQQLIDSALGATLDVRLRAVIEAVLVNPAFTRPTVSGDAAPEGAPLIELDASSLATRLSYFVWNSTPDAALLAAAESGALLDPVELVAQAQRLLDDPRARTMQGDLYEYLLHTNTLPTETKHESFIPPWSEELGAAMLVEQRRFVGDATTVEDLLTATYTFVNADLAAIYGDDLAGPAPAGAAFERVDLDAHRKGVLTRLAYLTSTTTGGNAIAPPTRRGQGLMEAFYCRVIPPPPPGVDMNPMDDSENFREMWEQSHVADATCAGCHALVDGPGWAFGNYDPLGRWIDEINGYPIDPGGELEPGDIAFANLDELIDIMVADEEVSACVAQRYFEFAVRRRLDERDACTLDQLATEFAASGGSFDALILAIVNSRAFRLARP